MTLRRDALCSLAAAMLLAACGPAAAQTGAAAKPFRIFMILFRGETPVEHGLRDYLHDRRIAADITVFNLANNSSRLPEAIAAAKAAHPDLVYTWGTGITKAVVGEYDNVTAANITDIPVLFTLVTDPVASRLIRAPGSSGRNFTGVSHIAPLETQIKAMQAYRRLNRLAVLYNPNESNSVQSVQQLRALLAAENIELIADAVPLDARGQPRTDVLPDMVAQVALREPQFLYIGPDTFIGENRDAITQAGIEHNLPTFTGTELEIRQSNAMVGLVTNYYALGKFAGAKAEQILVDRVPAGTIPIETLKRFNYMIKMGVADKLKLYPPFGLLDYAEIIP